MSKVVILKAITGDEIIATSLGNSVYAKPRVFITEQDGRGAQKAGLVPYIILAPDADVTLREDLVVAIVDCPAAVEKQYRQATSSIVLS